MDTKKLRQKILDLAIHGKLVPQDPNDEPASVLLERIKAEKEQLIEDGKIKRQKKATSSDTPHYGNDVPFEVPEGWVWCRLGDIGKWQSGATPSRTCNGYYGGNIPWLKTGDLNDGYIQDIPETITIKALNETSVKLNPAGSILIAMYGATIGKLGILKFPATTNQACCACVEFYGVLPMYLFFFLMENRTVFVEMGGGGAQPNISKEKIITTPIPIPPVTEQKRIIDAIVHYFSIITAVEHEQIALQKYISVAKSKILDLALSGRLTSHTSHYGKWRSISLKDVVQIKNGYAFKSGSYADSGIRVIRISNVQDGYISDDAPKYYPLNLMEGLEDYVLHQGDLLMSLTGNVGRVGFLSDTLMPAALNQRVACIRKLSEQIDLRYLFYIFKSHLFLEQCVASGKGVAQQNISTEWLKSFKIQLPPIEEQHEIVEALYKLFSLLDCISIDQS